MSRPCDRLATCLGWMCMYNLATWQYWLVICMTVCPQTLYHLKQNLNYNLQHNKWFTQFVITYKPFQDYHQSQLWAVKLKCSFQASAVALGIQIPWTWIAKLQINVWTWNWFCCTNIWLITRGRASKAVCGYGWSIYSFWDQQKIFELAEMQTSAGTNRCLPCACQSSSQELFYFAKWQKKKKKAQQKWYIIHF